MIADLRLQHFRSYIDDSFEFSPGVNIIVGPNASGKTNLLEAILVIARGSSYRARDKDLIAFNEPWARIDANLTSGTQRTIKLTSEPPAKIFEIAGKTHKRLTINYNLPTVLFEPNHLQLLSGGPERRRNFLDDIVEQIDPGYASIRRQYKRALAQRNSLLKHPHTNAVHTFPWNVRLSQLAGQIIRARYELVSRFQAEIGVIYHDISQVETNIVVHYGSRWSVDNYESNLLRKLESDLDTDRQRGFTAAGPHREDLIILFNGHPLQDVASRGESRTAILALKIIELHVLTHSRKISPVLLLDDVFSELDGKRRQTLTNVISKHQTFITTTDADLAIQQFAFDANTIPL